MNNLKTLEVWFLTGSQHLYGEDTLVQVAEHSREMAQSLNSAEPIPVSIVYKPVATTADAIASVCRDANNASNCIGLILWMHTFSPAKMWIGGLTRLAKPFLHLHTQYYRELPWPTIDMDFMNLHQSAHGDREFGFLCSRLRLERKVVVGYWKDAQVLDEIAGWSRAAAAWHDAQSLRIARFGDNMREVAVTEGNKVSAQIDLGYTVDGFGMGDLVEHVQNISASQVGDLIHEYDSTYSIGESLREGASQRPALLEAARIELGLRSFLEAGGFHAFTDTFQDLHGLGQLPGIAVQRLMADGYGFGGEGDWKTAALVRSMKVMSQGLNGGTSFMEDYTYDFGAIPKVLGSHMLEICPSIAADKPSVEIHPLSIGGKADPVRLVFGVARGAAINASLVDMGSRFRLIVNAVDVVPPDEPLPKLPVARAVWVPQPNLKIAASAWIYAGGAHHTGFSQCLTEDHMQDFAQMMGIEFLVIDNATSLRAFRNELRWNDASFGAARP